MPELKRSTTQNPLTGAGIIRYFDAEEGIQIDPKVFVGLTIAFIVFELFLQIF